MFVRCRRLVVAKLLKSSTFLLILLFISGFSIVIRLLLGDLQSVDAVDRSAPKASINPQQFLLSSTSRGSSARPVTLPRPVALPRPVTLPHRRLGKPITDAETLALFRDVLDHREDELLRRTLAVLATALDAANVTWFIDSGTLLGSFRHHGRIPWDDDADVIVSIAEQSAAVRALDALLPVGYRLRRRRQPSAGRDCAWNFAVLGPTNGTKRAPSVDVFWFDVDDVEGLVKNVCPIYDRVRMRKQDVFPLVRRPFAGLWLPAPRDTCAALATAYGYDDLDLCRSSILNHMMFKYNQRMATVPCRQLPGVPLVERRRRWTDPSTGRLFVVEALTVDNRTIDEQTVEFGQCIAGSAGQRGIVHERPTRRPIGLQPQILTKLSK